VVTGRISPFPEVSARASETGIRAGARFHVGDLQKGLPEFDWTL